jgi:hypothetical protein
MIEKIKYALKDQNSKLTLIGFIIFGLFLIVTQNKNTHKDEKNEVTSADTVIPKGHVLVPIEIQNIDSLSSLIGDFGLVDLFTTQYLNQKAGIRVGKRLKLLRAPLNPNTFAVLVPENLASEILAAHGPFVAVVQNPNNSLKSELAIKKSSPEIFYFRGSK